MMYQCIVFNKKNNSADTIRAFPTFTQSMEISLDRRLTKYIIYEIDGNLRHVTFSGKIIKGTRSFSINVRKRITSPHPAFKTFI